MDMQIPCVKTFFSKASNTGVRQGAILMPPSVDSTRTFDFYKPFVLNGFMKRTEQVGDSPYMTFLTAVQQSGSFSGLLDLYLQFMEANRDGVSANGFTSYENLPQVGNWAQYMLHHMNTDLYPTNYSAFILLESQWLDFWNSFVIAATVATQKDIQEFIERFFKTTDLQLWMPPGRYIVKDNDITDVVSASSITSTQVAVDGVGEPNAEDNQIFFLKASPWANLSSASKFRITLRPPGGIGPAPVTIDGLSPAPRFEDFPGAPMAAIAAWMADDAAGTLWNTLLVPPGQSLSPLPTFVMDAANGAPYGASGDSKFGSLGEENFDLLHGRVAFWDGPITLAPSPFFPDPLGNFEITELTFYNGGPNPLESFFLSIAQFYEDNDLGNVYFGLEEQKSIE